MKHSVVGKAVHLAVAFCAVFLPACGPVTPPAVPAQTETLTPAAAASNTPLAVTQTPARPTPTPPPAEDSPRAVGLDVQEVVGAAEGGFWSPVEDAIVFFLDQPSDTHDIVLARLAAPDFQPQEIRAVSPAPPGVDPCTNPGLLWSEDGQRIYFSGPQEDPASGGIAPCSLWVVGRDGSSPQRYSPEQKGRSLSPDAWLDDHTIIISGYREGTHVFDLQKGRTVNWIMPRSYGRSFITRSYLVGTDGSYAYKMYAVGSRGEPFDGVMEDSENNMRYALTPPPDSAYEWTGQARDGYTVAYDAIPGTNQVLGYWQQDIVHSEGEKILKIFLVQKLVLWDIDENTLTTLVPYGLWGRFSPDQRTLAYLTRGPAMLDAENLPIDPNTIDGFDPYALDAEPAYLQLLDRGTGSVYLSVPVASQRDFANYDYLHVGANFSPDGR